MEISALIDGLDVIRIGNWAIDRLLRVGEDEVLNSGPARRPTDDMCGDLMRASNEMKAAAMGEGETFDYGRLSEHEVYAEYRNLTRALKRYSPLKAEDRKGQTAFWINLYNALIVDAVISYRVSGSLRAHFSLFRRAAYDVTGHRFSADDIEHGVLRGNARHPFLPLRQFWKGDPRNDFVMDPPDPRIHFALNCAARSCPPLAFYDRENVDEQLDLATANFVNSGGARYEPDSNTLWLSRILDWYKVDFGGREGVRAFILDHLEDEEAVRAMENGAIRVRYRSYDWTLAGSVAKGAH